MSPHPTPDRSATAAPASASARPSRHPWRKVGALAAVVAVAGAAVASFRGGLFTRPVSADIQGSKGLNGAAGATSGARAAAQAGQPSRASEAELAAARAAASDGTLDVPSEVASLQTALDAAQDGQVVRLAAGVFHGPFKLGAHSVRLVGAGAGKTELLGTSNGPVLRADASGETRVGVEDLTIRGTRGARCTGLMVGSGWVEALRVSFVGHQNSGVLVTTSGKPVLVQCTFADNSSPFAGGGVCSMGGQTTLVSCSFDGNTALTFGGAVYVRQGSLQAMECIFAGNATTAGAYGGAFFSDDAHLVLSKCEFDGNESVESGGALYVRGGLAEVEECRFTGNHAESGWAVYSQGAGVRVERSVLCGQPERLLGGDLRSLGNDFNQHCFADCNQNGVDDAREIALGWAKDMDGNGVPDSCDADLNSNGIPDAYDIKAGFDQDRNSNGVPDTAEAVMRGAAPKDPAAENETGAAGAASPAGPAAGASAESKPGDRAPRRGARRFPTTAPAFAPPVLR